MNCLEFQIILHPYVDGELPVAETTAAQTHATECRQCGALSRHEREFRELLRRQPREAAPPALRARVRAGFRRRGRARLVRPSVLVPSLVAAAMLIALALWPSARPTPMLSALVDKHIAYAQLEQPAELPSSSPAEIAAWFRTRARLRVIVPDYSQAGIQLVGARIADADEHQAAYLLYRKGHTLLSVFMVTSELRPSGRQVGYRGHDYIAAEWKGHRTVAWTEGKALFGLVSSLGYEALLECADRLRVERARQTRL